MSIPPGPPAVPPSDQPPSDHSAGWRREKRLGAIVATLFVVLFSLTGVAGGWVTVLVLAPFLALFGVVLGSVLTIFERTRQFAVGFLIASAILIFVTAGVCVATLRSGTV